MAAVRDAMGNGGEICLAELESPPDCLLKTPLEYILADHFRQRCLCAGLRRIAERRGSGRGAAVAIISYLTTELPRHHQDEDQDLYPALRRRVRPEDELGGILERLEDDHRQAEAQAGAIVDALSAPPGIDPVVIDQSAAQLMLSYAVTEHRHLAIENGIVLVIARKRLKSQDIKALSEAMKSRRGIVS
jgi:hemerythrin-like domain-containing protein